MSGPMYFGTRLETPIDLPILLQVQQLTGISRSTLWREERAGRFPPRVRITENRIGWEEAEVLAWIEGKLQSRSNAHACQPIGALAGN